MRSIYEDEDEKALAKRMQLLDEMQERLAKEQEAKDIAERQIVALERIAKALETLAACVAPDSTPGYPSVFTTVGLR